MRALLVVAGLVVGCTGDVHGDTDDSGDTDVHDDTDAAGDTDTDDCITNPTRECDEACLALDEGACIADAGCRPYYGDRLDEGCIQRERFAACRHFDWDVDIDIDNWTTIGPDGACWLFDPGQSHPTFTAGCSYTDDFEGVPDCG